MSLLYAMTEPVKTFEIPGKPVNFFEILPPVHDSAKEIVFLVFF